MFSLFRKKKGLMPEICIAIYDSFACSPRIINCQEKNLAEAIEKFSQKIYQLAQEKGGKMPFSVIKELVENLLHAKFADATVTIYPDGNTIRFSDHGPGIEDPEKAFQPGFSSATSFEKKYIKGVGSGLPVVLEALKNLGGKIEIEENLQRGAVVTISLGETASTSEDFEIDPSTEEQDGQAGKSPPDLEQYNALDNPPKLTKRQLRVFLLITEEGEVGPSSAASKLGLSLTTAFRELSALEELGLVKTTEGGKRCLTPLGMKLVPEYIK